MKIFDCFLFSNELELLELRLMTLYDVVDYFVLVEAGMTHSGKRKELIFEKNKTNFEKYSNKIIHIKTDNLLHYDKELTYQEGWDNEFYNRNLIMDGLSLSNDDDYIMISDVDEIPNPKTLLYGIEMGYDIFALKQKLFYYYVNCLQNQEWFGTVLTKRKYFKSPQATRGFRNDNPINLINGGWHYSFLGDVEKIKIKIESYVYANIQKDISNNENHILKCLESGEDLFNRTGDMFKKRFISLEEIGHKELYEWLKTYPNFFKNV